MLSVSKPMLREELFLAAAIALARCGSRTRTRKRPSRSSPSAPATPRAGASPPEHAYPVRLQALLEAKGIDATVANAGIAGDTTGGMLARLDSAVPAGTALVVLQPGTNDERMGLGAERAGEHRENARRLDARGTKLLVIENSVLDALPRSELRDDGIHFTPAGYALLAERILPDVLAALGK